MEVEGARRPVRRPSRGLDVRRGGPSDVHRGASTATSASVGARRRRSRNFPRQVEAPLGGHPDGGRGTPMDLGGPDGPRGTPMDLGGPRWRSGGTPDGGREHPDGGRAATPMELGPPRRPSRQTSTASGRHLDLHRGAPTTPSRFSGRVCISTRRDSWPLGAPPGGPSERSYGLVYLIPTPPSRRTARGAAGKGRNEHFGRVRRGGFLDLVNESFCVECCQSEP